MASGLHGENGLDPETSLHLMKSYVIPVLLYGLEILVPKGKDLSKLECFQKKILKQILSLPVNTADVAIYILTGFISVEAQIHKRILSLFHNICLQEEASVEKQLARRQLAVKPNSSRSWFVQARSILWRYGLQDPEELLDFPPSVAVWKTTVNKAVYGVWRNDITDLFQHSSSARNINISLFRPGKPHPLLQIPIRSTRDTPRWAVKLKLLTGTYILQSNRAAFNQNAVNPTCKLCCNGDETVEHFLLNCQKLADRRDPILSDIDLELSRLGDPLLDSRIPIERIRVILDPTHTLRDSRIVRNSLEPLTDLEFHSKRLVYFLHSDRYKLLKQG